MPRCLVVQQPSGNVVVIHPAPKARRAGESDSTFHARIFADTLDQGGWTALPTLEMGSSDLPARAQRHKWRLQGGQVRVDPTVPDPPHPQQGLLDRIALATTVEQLKPILMDFIRSS